MNEERSESESASALAPFRHGIFRAVWGASLVSNFGGLIQGVGAAWMMTSIATSSYQVALVQASTTLPIMLFALVAGAIADSFNRRKVMLFAQVFMLVVSVLLTVFTWFGWMTPWILLTFTFLIDSGTALNSPSWQASVGDIVPRAKVPAAVALNSMGFNLTRSVGPAIGGVIVAAFGAAAAFAANALSYVGLIVVLFRWKPETPAPTLPRESLGAAMGAGLRYVAMSPNIGKVLVRGCAFGFSAGAVLALLPLVARDVVKGDALTYGIMLGAFGIGAVGGALISVRLRQMLSSEMMVRLAFVGFALCALDAAVSKQAWQTSLGLLAGGAIGLFLPLPQQSILNLDPLNRFKEPHLALDLKPRSGPIAIMIEYIIREEDVPEFLATMVERGRIRRRDGARHWTLARDLEDPAIWIEHYHTPTWLEYVRHNGRATHADAVVGERLRALHSGTEPPRVRRVIERPATAATTLVMAKGPIEH